MFRSKLRVVRSRFATLTTACAASVTADVMSCEGLASDVANLERAREGERGAHREDRTGNLDDGGGVARLDALEGTGQLDAKLLDADDADL